MLQQGLVQLTTYSILAEEGFASRHRPIETHVLRDGFKVPE